MKKLVILFASILVICNIYIHNNTLTSDKQPKSYIEYIVVEGDCLSLIAEQYKPENISLSSFVEKLKYINNKPNEVVNIGDVLLIPGEVNVK